MRTLIGTACADIIHDRYAYRPNYPYPMYYGRPVYYAPAPFLPIPPFFGYGWEWWISLRYGVKPLASSTIPSAPALRSFEISR
jgi:hypothetical protein